MKSVMDRDQEFRQKNEMLAAMGALAEVNNCKGENVFVKALRKPEVLSGGRKT